MDKVTSIESLRGYMEGQVVRFPDFSEGQPFIARVRRPSMLVLIKAGKIPNSLLVTANKLFLTSSVDEADPQTLDQLFSILDVLCEACLIEPSYQEVKDAGIEFTDEQYMFIFNYTQKGIKMLEPFRGESAADDGAGYVAEVSAKTVDAT